MRGFISWPKADDKVKMHKVANDLQTLGYYFALNYNATFLMHVINHIYMAEWIRAKRLKYFRLEIIRLDKVRW